MFDGKDWWEIHEYRKAAGFYTKVKYAVKTSHVSIRIQQNAPEVQYQDLYLLVSQAHWHADSGRRCLRRLGNESE